MSALLLSILVRGLPFPELLFLCQLELVPVDVPFTLQARSLKYNSHGFRLRGQKHAASSSKLLLQNRTPDHSKSLPLRNACYFNHKATGPEV